MLIKCSKEISKERILKILKSSDQDGLSEENKDFDANNHLQV